MKTLRRIFVIALSMVVIGISRSTQSQTAPTKPNIVFILTDNLGYGELGVYGGGILCVVRQLLVSTNSLPREPDF